MSRADIDEVLKGLSRGDAADIAAAVAALEAADSQGEPDASRWLALLAGAGVGMPQSWECAVDLLKRAASLGSAAAAGQLGVLGGDLSAWMAPCEKSVLHASPRTVAIRAFLPPGVAPWLIERAAHRLTPALVYGRAGVRSEQSATRGNTAFEFAFVDCDLVVLLTRKRIAEAIGVPIAALESSQILHYDVGESFARHYDFLDPADPAQAIEIAARGQRIVTFLIYLNVEFEGGETHFPTLGFSHRGAAGDALYFGNLDANGAPDRRTLHVGMAPTRGEKWLFSQWIRNRAIV